MAVKSKQPRFTADQLKQFYALIERWVEESNFNAPPYGVNSMPRDEWLRQFWHREPLWAGVLKSTMNIDKNRGWTLTGGRNQVAQYTKVLREAEGGAGWRRYVGLQSLSYYTADIGAITELGFDSVGGEGPLRALWSVDPARCELTGKRETPLRYHPASGVQQDWKPDWYMRAVSMESTDEAMLGLGYCATDMALDLATIMVAIWRHDKEMLFAKMQKGLLLMQGISEGQWETAMEAHAERLTAKEREFFSGLSIFFGDQELDAKLVALSQLWEGFTLQEWVNVLMNGYALIVGYDTTEFWPVNWGGISHGTETEVSALKATGKGGLDFVLAYQDNLQRELPETLLFEFEQRNEQGDIMEADVAERWGVAINAMAAPSGPGMAETLSVEEKRQLLAQRGLIPDEWTAEEEEETTSDTDSAPEERAIPDYVLRAARAFPGEPIVRYSWPAGHEEVIWKPTSISVRRQEADLCGGEALDLTKIISRQNVGKVASLYRDDLENAIYNAWADLENNLYDPKAIKTALVTKHKRAIREFGPEAFAEGLREGGVTAEDMDDDDKRVLAEWVSSQQSYVTPFAGDVMAAAGDQSAKDAILGRVDLWVQSIETLGAQGAMSAKANAMVTWRLGPTEEHCDTCAGLDGQRHRAKWFTGNGYIPREPGSATLACQGFRCLCFLEAADGSVFF
jgi:hypothetical protein